MLRTLFCLVTILVALAHASGCQQAKQPVPALIRPGYFIPGAKAQLAAAWSDSIMQVERGYCGAWHVEQLGGGDSVYVIDSVVPAVIEGAASPMMLPMRCPKETAPIHTHLPQTCHADATGHFSKEHCEQGGYNAEFCFPSNPDITFVTWFQHEFGVIQCGPRHFVFYRPLLRTFRAGSVQPRRSHP